MSWISETWYNLTHMVAFKAMVANFKASPWQWFLNELSPSSYMNPDHKLHWANMLAEMKGWFGEHIPIGMASMLVWLILAHFFKKPSWWGFLWIGMATFVVEIIQEFVAKWAYINPLNSALDIGFYLVGGALIYIPYKKWFAK